MNTLLWVGVALAASLALTKPAIRAIQLYGAGQQIRAEGPKSHLSKQGTPTMGGIVFLLVLTVLSLGLLHQDWLAMSALGLTLGFGLTGAADDMSKVTRGRSLGLRARSKTAVGLLLATGFAYIAQGPLALGMFMRVPVTRELIALPPLAYYVLVNLTILGTANAVNITDGLDGLATGLGILALGFYAALSLADGAIGLGVFALLMCGALGGFLYFNLHPARVFMGDTGSLAIGAALSAVAVLTRSELLLVVVGGVFVLETLSVVIQVISFRVFGRRVFRMSPLHHHFELAGWSEVEVVTRFWLAGLLLAMVSYLLWWP